MKQFIFLSIVYFILFHFIPHKTEAQIGNSNDAFKALETQIILSQSAVNDFFLIGINCDKALADEARLSLNQSIEDFDEFRIQLSNYFANNCNTVELNDLYMYWESCREILFGVPDKYSASLLLDLNSEMLNEFETLVALLKETCQDKDEIETLHTMYNQRYLSERMAYLYIGNTWGIESDINLKKEFTKCRKEFLQGMKTIRSNNADSELYQEDISLLNERINKNSFEFDFDKAYIGMVYTDSKYINQKTETISTIFEDLFLK
jgi:hypothetical protein